MKELKFNVDPRAMLVLGGALVGGGIGGLAGYQYGRVVLGRRFSARLDEEVVKLKEHYDQRLEDQRDRILAVVSTGHPFVGPSAVGDFATAAGPEVSGPESGPDADPASLERPGGGNDDGLDGGDELDLGNGDAEPDPFQKPPGSVELITSRDTGKPYAISVEEFGESPPGIQQLTITYYGGDKVLADDQDQPIRDIDGTVGELSPLSFGGISGDPHIRYVRNEKLQIDFEIILSAETYAGAVLNYGNPNPAGKGT